jgi:hypothetical protein
LILHLFVVSVVLSISFVKRATSFFNASGPVIGVNCELESAARLAIAAVVVNAARWRAGGGFIVRGVW